MMVADTLTASGTELNFGDLEAAARMREVLDRRIIKLIDSARPNLKKGSVTQIDPDIRRVMVSFRGGDPVSVKVGALMPTFIGQTVHVAGPIGDQWVVNLIGAAGLTEATETELGTPAGFDLSGTVAGIAADWDAVDNATRYEIQIAENNLFTVGVISYFTVNNSFLFNGLEPNVTMYGRVRAANSGSGRGPWSAIDSAAPLDYPNQVSDGVAPTVSPTPNVTPMLHALIAEWVASSNPDLTHYDVHVSTTSGFTPGPTTLLGSTTGTFYIVRHLPDGTPLSTSTHTFVRLIARDADGAAPVGPQGFGIADLVDTGDVGRIETGKIGDGLAPSSSPNAPVLTGGLGFIYALWDHVANADPVTYEVHISTTSGFLPVAGTLVGTTSGNWFFIRNVGSSGGGAALAYGTTYYVKIIAKDIDGLAAPGTQSSGNTTLVNTPDIAAGAITAASAIIADAAIGSAKIQDAAIVTAKIADLNVSTAKIADLAVTTAKINDLAVGTAKIQDAAITNAKIVSLSADKITAGTIGAQEIIMNGASSIIRSSNFVAGVSGYRFKGDGVLEARNAVISGTVTAADITGSTITGNVIQTAVSGARVVINQSEVERITFYNNAGTLIGTIGTGAITGKGVAGTDVAVAHRNGGRVVIVEDGSTLGGYIQARTFYGGSFNGSSISTSLGISAGGNISTSGLFIGDVAAGNVTVENLWAGGGDTAIDVNCNFRMPGNTLSVGTIILGSGTLWVDGSGYVRR